MKQNSKYPLCFRVIEWLMLLLTPAGLLAAVQMITSIYMFRAPETVKLSNICRKTLEIQPEYLLKNLLICYVLFFLLILLVRRVNIACCILSIVLIVAALVNFYVVQFRGQAFMLLDILGMGTAAEVVDGYQFQVPFWLGVIVLCVLIWVILQMKFQKLCLGPSGKKFLLARICGLAVILAVLACMIPGWWKTEEVSLWNVKKEYIRKGYLYELLVQGKYLEVEKPKDYSPEKAEKIAVQAEEEYTKKKTAKVQDISEQPTNIIMIMNESLADFESVGKIQTEDKILPFIRSLNQKNVKYGHMYVHTYGGGTARSEYEALTGNSMFFLPAASVPYQLYIREPEYGITDILKSQGYETIAVHPNAAANWNRSAVYPKMGFDEFISSENWGDLYNDKIRKFTSDEAVYDKLISLCDEKEKGQKLFTFCVTMQNHGGYGKGTRNGYQPSIKLNYDTEYPQAETYLSLARESDNAFKKLIEHFEKEDEPTMIILFGDHWPTLEDDFLSEILGKDKGSLDLIESQVTYTTPYVIWTNYDSETVDQDISCNYLGSYVLEQAGVELPQYEQFLLNLKDELPVIGVDAVEDKDGNWYSTENLPEKYKKLMDEYSILQYNNQFEKKQIKETAFRTSEQ